MSDCEIAEACMFRSPLAVVVRTVVVTSAFETLHSESSGQASTVDISIYLLCLFVISQPLLCGTMSTRWPIHHALIRNEHLIIA